MTTKIELINQAYSLIRISGITLDPSGEDISLALDRLETMAAEFYGRNIKTDYNFEEKPTTEQVVSMIADLVPHQRKDLIMKLDQKGIY